LGIELDGRSNVKCIPLPSQNAVVAGRQVRRYSVRDGLLVALIALGELSDLEIFLLGVRFVDIVGEVQETITDVVRREIPSERAGLPGR
jgi:hypothetical protein